MANIIYADVVLDKHYKLSGFSDTISDSYASPATFPTGMTWDGTNVLSATNDLDGAKNVKHYQHTGFSTTINDSYKTPFDDPCIISGEE